MSPVIYKYNGLRFFLNTGNEIGHKIHVHVQYAEFESKVDIEYHTGRLQSITFKKATTSGKKQLPLAQQTIAERFIKKYHSKISDKWFQVLYKNISPKCETITTKI